MQKDLRLALDLGADVRAPLPSTAAADKVLDVARAAGYEHRDIAVLYRLLAEAPEATLEPRRPR
jgi:3-hydroxyisobutyrate dehydrogenase-like beta-hydroxyacid dehydrogenase